MSPARIVARSVIAGVGLAALAGAASAQTATPAAEEVAALRAQIQALSARLEQLEAQVANPTPASAPVQAQTERRAEAAPPLPPSSVDWAGGVPELRSPDGAFSFRPRLRVTADLSTTAGSDHDRRNLTGTEMRGLRLGAVGRVAGGFSYWVEADVSAVSVTANNAFLAYGRRLGGRELEVSFGQRLNDRGVDGGTPGDLSPFLENGLAAAALGPERGVNGLGVTSRLLGEAWHVSLSVTGDPIGDGTTNDTLTVMGRAHRALFRGARGFAHLGGWGYVEDLAPGAAPVSRHLLVAPRFNDNLRLSGAPLAQLGSGRAFGLEAGGVRGPAWLMVEGGRRTLAAAGGDADHDALTVSAGVFLTGETPPLSPRTGAWTRPRVLNPVGAGGRGALELAGRYDHAELGDVPAAGGGPATQGAAEGEVWTLGLNWYPTANTRISAHWSAWSVDNRTGAFPGQDSGHTATVRVQAGF